MSNSRNPAEPTCFFKYGFPQVPRHVFKGSSCAQCAHFLFPSLPANRSGSVFQYLHPYNSKEAQIFLDVEESSSFQTQCTNLVGRGECGRLLQCCKSALECCDWQILTSQSKETTSQCPSVWDGYLCWNTTRAGEQVKKICPPFLPYAISGGNVSKTCTENGSWYTGPNHLGWSNYTECVELNTAQIPIWIGVALNLVSLCFLLPALGIFLGVERLRSHQRVRLHVSLLLALLVRSLAKLSWETFVTIPQLMLGHSGYHLLDGSSVKSQIICSFLLGSLLYGESCCYFGFLNEGIYLYRLIANAFEPPRRLSVMVICAWGFPLLAVSLYLFMRSFVFANGQEVRCWVVSNIYLEWIHQLPNVICVLTNIGFLLYILRVLIRRFCWTDSDWMNLRRSFKAVAVLVPLFGIQVVFTSFRPTEMDKQSNDVFSVCSAIFQDTQGIWSSLVLCFFNREVKLFIQSLCSQRGTYPHFRRRDWTSNRTRSLLFTSSTNKSSNRRRFRLSLQSFTNSVNSRKTRQTQEQNIPLVIATNANSNNLSEQTAVAVIEHQET